MIDDPERWPVESPLAVGKRVLNEEGNVLIAAAERLGGAFADVVTAIISCNGRVVLSGVGKSGHVARKIAATFASTGTPAFFVHAAEAGHGDLGMITSADILIALSNSGESEEVVNIASFAKRFGARIVAITGKALSGLGRISDHCLLTTVEREACPLGVAPTSSTTLQLAMGDALAMATLAQRGFSTEDFARTHPLGQLGRHHYLRVGDVMQPIAEVPTSEPNEQLKNCISAMAIGRAGALVVLNRSSLIGIFTDSDLRRLISNSKGSIDCLLDRPIEQFVTRSPMVVESNILASQTLKIFEEKKVSRLVCLDSQRVVGLLAWHDLLRHKVA